MVSVHFRVRVAQTGLELERSRNSSGTGDRMFGEPLTFVLGDRSDKRILGAVHVATVGMRVGGRREVRLAFHDPDFGYRIYPQDERGRWIALHPWTEIVVELELDAIRQDAPPTGVWDHAQRGLHWAQAIWSDARS
mgnify:FL=1